MPHYDYECKKCGYRFEAFQKISDKPISKCPKCKSAVKRLISSGAGLIFKGSGFYSTDYKKAGAAQDPSRESCKENPSCPTCPNNIKKSSDSASKEKKKNR